MATRTQPDKKMHAYNNSYAQALYNFVHVFTVLCKTTTNSWNFYLKLNAAVMCLVSVSFQTNRRNEQI